MTEFLDSASLLKINNINSSIRRKRINSEIIELKKTYAFVDLSFDNDKDLLILTIIDNNLNQRFNNLSFILPNEYPFKPPKILINGEDYMNLLKISNSDKLNALKSLTNKSCLCCDTNICNDNWSPALTCCRIITEINKNFKIIEKITLKIAFDKLKLLLNDDYKNIENIVPFMKKIF
jgi:ubiquitin-protein ligase